MRILDLFCNAGGAGMGYHRAGFEVVGVDLEPQRNYPFAFIQHDALTLDRRFLRSFDAIHASPPCQGYTGMNAPGQVGAPQLIDLTRRMLQATGLPYVIENVEGAVWDMRNPITLCGSMFGLGAQGCQLRRHRLFESNIAISPPSPCQHDARPVIGVYGGHARRRAASAGGRGTRDEHLTRYDPRASTRHDKSWVKDVRALYAHPSPTPVGIGGGVLSERAKAMGTDLVALPVGQLLLECATAMRPAADADRVRECADLFKALRDESWDLRCFDVPTGGDDCDIGWRVVGHWQAEPKERVIAEVFVDDPAAAVRQALAALKSTAAKEGGE